MQIHLRFAIERIDTSIASAAERNRSSLQKVRENNRLIGGNEIFVAFGFGS